MDDKADRLEYLLNTVMVLLDDIKDESLASLSPVCGKTAAKQLMTMWILGQDTLARIRKRTNGWKKRMAESEAL